MKQEREVAGLRCSDVLARLSDYLDGDLPPPDAERLREHLRGCAECERFGGAMAELVRSLRRELADSDDGPPRDVVERLRARLRGASR
jgi:anti-sigma factor (TIGR02949 family)